MKVPYQSTAEPSPAIWIIQPRKAAAPVSPATAPASTSGPAGRAATARSIATGLRARPATIRSGGPDLDPAPGPPRPRPPLQGTLER